MEFGELVAKGIAKRLGYKTIIKIQHCASGSSEGGTERERERVGRVLPGHDSSPQNPGKQPRQSGENGKDSPETDPD